MKIPSEMAGVSKHIATSSAMNPTLLLCLICSPICFVLSWMSGDFFRVGFFLAGLSPLAVGIWQIVRFTLIYPDRLQNDRHVENKMMISRFGSKNGDETLEVLLPATATVVDNPLLDESGR
jgi:hypothetical protein